MVKNSSLYICVRSILVAIAVGSSVAPVLAQDGPVYPDIEGKQLAAVKSLIEGLGIELRLDEIDAPGRKGRIIEQIPPAFTPMGETARMLAVVSNGLVVPDVIGKNVDVVKAELEEKGYSVEISRSPQENMPKNIVAFVLPKEGSRIDPQNEAVFLISSSQHLVRVPSDLVGKKVSDVTKNANINFTARITRRNITKCWLPGTYSHYVTSSSPAPGSLVVAGSEVKLEHRSVETSPGKSLCNEWGVPY